MRQVLYLIQKEFRQIFRENAMIGIIFIAPLLQILVIGHAISTDVTNVNVLFHDADRSSTSRQLIDAFRDTKYFNVIGYENDYGKLSSYLDRGEASIIVVVPEHFQRDIVRGSRPSVQVLVDALDGNSAGIAMSYVQSIVQKLQADIVVREPQLAGKLAGTWRVNPEPRFWYNPNLVSRVYIVPGIVAMILVIITLFLTSMAIVREKEIGTLEQLMVTPIRAWQLIAGKIIPFAILGIIEIVAAITFVWLVFGIGVAGSIPLLFGESCLFILTTLGLGILISTISETQQQSLFVAWFFMIFSILLSGFFIPIANMPDAIQLLTRLNPVRYYLVVMREIYLKGTPLSELWPETLAMMGFGVLLFSMAVLRFRRRLQ
jgi:ABC-2 type transport system permease protein